VLLNERGTVIAPSVVPAALERAILSCLEKSPDRRPASALALAAELAAIGRDLPWSPEHAEGAWRP
jgi:hypothetical protein